MSTQVKKIIFNDNEYKKLYFSSNEIDALFPVVLYLTIGEGLMEITIQYVDGMTWAQWVASEYNTIGASVEDGHIKVNAQKYVEEYNVGLIQDTDTIDSTKTYIWTRGGGGNN